MAVEKVGVYRRWLEPVPEENGEPVQKSQWPKKRRHSWTVRWYGTTGKRYSRDFKTKKLAERYARDLQGQVDRGKQDRPDKITMHEFIEEHKKVMKGQVAYATLSDQRRALELFEKFVGGSIFLNRIKPRHAESFISHRFVSGITVATVNKDIRTLQRIFNLAIEPRGYLAEGQNPFARIKKRKEPEHEIRYVTTGEYRALLSFTPNIWWKALFSVAYGSGLRREEILNLTWIDIDFEKQQIKVSSRKASENILEWQPKSRRNRIVPMPDETAQLLADK